MGHLQCLQLQRTISTTTELEATAAPSPNKLSPEAHLLQQKVII